MSPEERTRKIAEYEREESRHFKAADDLKAQAARRESEGYQAQIHARELRAQIAREELLAPFVDALKIASGYVSSHLGHLQAQDVTGPALDKALADYEATLAALAKAEAR
ncbi:hypothetical protein [Hansschlegelia sp.]|uniref:hypothetical protein n=1 Tax=Hansschlegelia sp. TaxID=2041892 RepID=UPI002BEB4DC3|nr:hypothetical protein [Hansschlegelia sp.]HVI27493.1 hypothetical protein [Hansschlegelia sp.]